MNETILEIGKYAMSYVLAGGFCFGFLAAGADTKPTASEIVCTVLLWPWFMMVLVGILIRRLFP